MEGSFCVEVVGESFYQEAFIALCGPKGDDSVDIDCVAALEPEPANPYDSNAVRVLVKGHHLGHIARGPAAIMQPLLIAYNRRYGRCLVKAKVVGGWDRGPSDQGMFGVQIWCPPPEGFR